MSPPTPRAASIAERPVERTVHTDLPNETTQGVYDLTVKACNPGC